MASFCPHTLFAIQKGKDIEVGSRIGEGNKGVPTGTRVAASFFKTFLKGGCVMRKLSSMPFGKYQGMLMTELPPDYLLNLYSEFKNKKTYGKMTAVIKYIRDNYDEIYQEYVRLKTEFNEKNPEEARKSLRLKAEEAKYNFNRRNKYLGKNYYRR